MLPRPSDSSPPTAHRVLHDFFTVTFRSGKPQSTKAERGSLCADTSQVCHFPLVFPPSQLPGRWDIALPIAFLFPRGLPREFPGRVSPSRPAESSRGQAV